MYRIDSNGYVVEQQKIKVAYFFFFFFVYMRSLACLAVELLFEGN